MGKIITRADVKRRVESIKPIEFEVPELDGAVLLKVMSGSERDEYESSLVGGRAPSADRKLNLLNIRARTVAYCWVDEAGKPVYNVHNPSDLDELGALDAPVLQRIFKKCQEINALSDEDVNTLAKKSQSRSGTDSGSFSPESLDTNPSKNAKNT